MATNRGLTGWRRRETAREAEERRQERERVRISPDAKAQLAYWRALSDTDWGIHFVYFIVEFNDGINAVKIGTAADPLARAISLQIGNPRPLQLAQVLYGTPASEEGYHELWQKNRIRGEWFAPADEILEWASWAAQVQREQREEGLLDLRVRSTYGKHPKDWRQPQDVAA